MALSQKVIIVNQPGASGSIGRWPPRRLRQINMRLIDADEAGPNVSLRANWTVRWYGGLWPKHAVARHDVRSTQYFE